MLFAFVSGMGNLFWEAGYIRDMTPHQADNTAKKKKKNPRWFYIEDTSTIFITEDHTHKHLP